MAAWPKPFPLKSPSLADDSEIFGSGNKLLYTINTTEYMSSVENVALSVWERWE
jgi:hypothetical protein